MMHTYFLQFVLVRGWRTVVQLTSVLALVVFFVLPASATHQPSAPSPDHDYVWQRGYILNGISYRGFLRIKSRPGFAWRERQIRNGVWRPARWVPVQRRPGYIWVSGHRGVDGYWVFGHWRPVSRAGFVWVNGGFHDGVYIPGYWKPLHSRRGFIWVRGHRTPNGDWVSGFWRPASRPGFFWVAGRFRQGEWVPSHWAPMRGKRSHVWVAGYRTSDGRWVKGYWRPASQKGYAWVSGHWQGSLWIPGGWARHSRVSLLPSSSAAHAEAAIEHQREQLQKIERRRYEQSIQRQNRNYRRSW